VEEGSAGNGNDFRHRPQPAASMHRWAHAQASALLLQIAIHPNAVRLSTAHTLGLKSSRRNRSYFVVYPPLISMVWPVIHHPSLTRWRMNGTTSSMSVNPVFENFDNAAAALWYDTASAPSAG
jgi:hypothetical protein